MNLLNAVYDVVRNLALNTLGVERDLLTLIADKDIDKALELFENNDEKVQEAIKEYHPEKHDIMVRPDKERKNRENYTTAKLSRSWQRYINEVALFFLLAKPIRFSCDNEDVLALFNDFLKSVRFNSNMRKFKRLAGAETESAKMYYTYRDKSGEIKTKIIILSRETGYTLRPLMDQYGRMVAFGYGYYLKQGETNVECLNIETDSNLYVCKKAKLGWTVQAESNPTGKIRIIYGKQPKEWEGSEPRITRDEWVDSKTADVNEYFADPVAKGTAGALKNLMDPKQVGKLVVLDSKDDIFDYVEPPTQVELKKLEKEVLKESILHDTFTPDFSFDSMKGTGTLSGEAIRRAMILGYIKRDNRKEIYDELVDREINLIKEILSLYYYPEKRSIIEKSKITHEFAEPFDEDTASRITTISDAYTSGVLSLEKAVEMLAFSTDNKKEIEAILQDQKRKNESSTLPFSEE